MVTSTLTNIDLSVEQREGRRITSSIAMVILLTTFSMLFATLLLGFTIYRLTSTVWPPMGMERVSLFVPSISTGLILISSFFFSLYEKAFFVSNLKKNLWFYLSVSFGAFFMMSQLYLWSDFKVQGIFIQDGIFPSLLYTLTWIHAAHVIVAWLLLFYLIPTLNAEANVIKLENRVLNIGKFWHFLGVVWLVIFIAMFVL